MFLKTGIYEMGNWKYCLHHLILELISAAPGRKLNQASNERLKADQAFELNYCHTIIYLACGVGIFSSHRLFVEQSTAKQSRKLS